MHRSLVEDGAAYAFADARGNPVNSRKGMIGSPNPKPPDPALGFCLSQDFRYGFLKPAGRDPWFWALALRKCLKVCDWIHKIFKAGIQFPNLRCQSFENGSWGVMRKCSLG